MAHDDVGHALLLLLQQELALLLDLAHREPREHLVEEQDRRFGRQGARELELAQLAHGKLLRQHCGFAFPEADAVEDPPLGAQWGLVEEQRRDTVRHHAHPDVLAHRHLAEGPRDLVGAGDTTGHSGVGRQAGDVLAPEVNPAVLGPVLAHHDAEGGGLAGAVRADEAERLPALDVEAQAVHRGEAAEALGHVAKLQDPGHCAVLPDIAGTRRPANDPRIR